MVPVIPTFEIVYTHFHIVMEGTVSQNFNLGLSFHFTDLKNNV